ncbi:MAG: hypothetical protein KIT09_28495 [Bryobacteraceae bacterium]|nr:hypothetical protein [Bryobacteraceae bacterium]
MDQARKSAAGLVQRHDSRAEAEEIVTWACEQLGLGGERSWTLVSSKRKLRKLLFEIEERGPEGGRRLIGRVAPKEGAGAAFHSAATLRNAGMRPPNRWTVAEPVAWLPERQLLIQEKAPGEQIAMIVQQRPAGAEPYVTDAAGWLAFLHGLELEHCPVAKELASLERCAAELPRALPAHAERIEATARRALDLLEARHDGTVVASHGDFHPLNIFHSEKGRVTAIDLDTFGFRERAVDAAYFAAQLAMQAFLHFRTFEAAAPLVGRFRAEYESAAGVAIPRARWAAHTAAAFLRGLHFEHCILHTGNRAIIEPWLRAAERSVEGDPEPARD